MVRKALRKYNAGPAGGGRDEGGGKRRGGTGRCTMWQRQAGTEGRQMAHMLKGTGRLQAVAGKAQEEGRWGKNSGAVCGVGRVGGGGGKGQKVWGKGVGEVMVNVCPKVGVGNYVAGGSKAWGGGGRVRVGAVGKGRWGWERWGYR